MAAGSASHPPGVGPYILINDISREQCQQYLLWLVESELMLILLLKKEMLGSLMLWFLIF